MRKLFFHFWLLAFLFVSLSLSVPAQARRPRTVTKPAAEPTLQSISPADDSPSISVDTTEVLLPVTVRDTQGRFVPQLSATDFAIYEDGIPQQISSFALKRLPVHVLLMIDTSSSVQRELDDFKAIAMRFAERLSEADSLSLIRFDDKVELVMDWTTSRTALRRALNRVGTGMFTRFNDAMLLAAREQLSHINGRKAIIVFTDGIDSGRGKTPAEVALRAIVEAETPVYVVSKTRIQRRTSLEELDYYEKSTGSTHTASQLRIDGIRMSLATLETSEQFLTRIVEETGGRLFLPQRFENLDEVYQEVADELQHQYVIFYTPSDTRRDGRYRRTYVRINRPACSATTRLGYYLR